MPMLQKRKKGGTVVFVAGKWAGKTLQEVAGSDPSYLTWVYKKASADLDQELFYKLKDTMKDRSIPFEFPTAEERRRAVEES